MSHNLSRSAVIQSFSPPFRAEDPTSEGILPWDECAHSRLDHAEDPCADCTPPRGDYARDGFVTLEKLITPATVDILNERLERVLRGQYDTGTAPDKRPKLVKDNNKGVLGFSGNTQGVRTLQFINMWKADTQFKQLVLSSKLGHIVAELAGWKSGARLAQDQVWAKPPGSPPLVFHRDSPYFDFNPSDVATVWLALDHMDPCLGPLQYVKGSHHWGEGRTGSANMFFDKDTKALLYSAAEREGVSREEVDDHLLVSMEGMVAGGCSIHDGKTWHGSGPNVSSWQPRRGLGLHFIPADATFKPGEEPGKLWKPFKQAGSDQLPDAFFPVTCDRRTI